MQHRTGDTLGPGCALTNHFIHAEVASPVGLTQALAAMESTLAVEPCIETTVGHCDTCGHDSKVFRGFVYEHGNALGLHLCHYTDSHPEQGVSMAVSLRGWGEGAAPSEKECVALEWLTTESGPGCRVVDAEKTSWAGEPMLGRMPSREEMLGTGRAKEAFGVSDVVRLNTSGCRRRSMAANNSSKPTPLCGAA